MGLSLSIKMNRERLPTSGARASAKVTLHSTRAELRALDRFCAERLLTRSQVVRRSFKTHLLDRAIGAEECYSPRRRSPIPLITSFIRNIGTCLEDKLLNLRDLQPAGARTCNPSPFAEKFRYIFVTNS
jgi:hypothetical protein